MDYVIRNTLMDSTLQELTIDEWSDRLDNLSLWGILQHHHEIYGDDSSRDLRKNVLWEKFSRRIDSHPHESTDERSKAEGQSWIFPPKGWYPLHEALAHGAPKYIIQKLTTLTFQKSIDNYDILKASQTDGVDTPLHVACRTACTYGRFSTIHESNSTPEVLLVLIKANPEALRRKDHNGNIPLHLLSMYHFPRWKENMDLLISEHTKHFGKQKDHGDGCGGILVQNENGVTPLDVISKRFLHEGCSYDDWEWYCYLLQLTATKLSVPNTTTTTPLLHAAIRLRCPKEMIHQIISKNEDYVRTTDHLGRLPLFEAIKNRHISSNIVLCLLRKYTIGASVTDNLGRLPLHYAAINCGSNSLVYLQELIQAFPEALETRDKVSALLPFMLPATTETKNVGDIIRTTFAYEILRANPAVVQHGL